MIMDDGWDYPVRLRVPEGISSSIRMFADDTVIYRQINSAADHTILQ